LNLPALEVIDRLKEKGVGATFVSGKVRMVTHVDISDEGVQTALAAWREIAAAVA
jgi:threonine aldolase